MHSKIYWHKHDVSWKVLLVGLFFEEIFIMLYFIRLDTFSKISEKSKKNPLADFLIWRGTNNPIMIFGVGPHKGHEDVKYCEKRFS